MSAIPDPSLDYRSSHSAIGYGHEYVGTFAPDRLLGQLWVRTELPILQQHIDETGLTRSARVLDFACGTGRITRALTARFDHVTGVDVSGSMLEVARGEVGGAQFLEHDLTVNENRQLGEFDLASAFRFFRNASPDLRSDAMGAIHSILRPGGFFVANIHGNPIAPGIAILKLRNRNNVKIKTLSEPEFEKLFTAAGFSIVSKTRYGIAPSIGNSGFDPYVRTARFVEKAAALPLISRLAESTIYLLQKGESSS